MYVRVDLRDLISDAKKGSIFCRYECRDSGGELDKITRTYYLYHTIHVGKETAPNKVFDQKNKS